MQLGLFPWGSTFSSGPHQLRYAWAKVPTMIVTDGRMAPFADWEARAGTVPILRLIGIQKLSLRVGRKKNVSCGLVGCRCVTVFLLLTTKSRLLLVRA